MGHRVSHHRSASSKAGPANPVPQRTEARPPSANRRLSPPARGLDTARCGGTSDATLRGRPGCPEGETHTFHVEPLLPRREPSQTLASTGASREMAVLNPAIPELGSPTDTPRFGHPSACRSGELGEALTDR